MDQFVLNQPLEIKRGKHTLNPSFGIYGGGLLNSGSNSFPEIEDPLCKNLIQATTQNMASCIEYVNDWMEVEPEKEYFVDFEQFLGTILLGINIHIDEFTINAKKQYSKCKLAQDIGPRLISSIKLMTNSKNELEEFTGENILDYFKIFNPPKTAEAWNYLQTNWGHSNTYTTFSSCKTLNTDPAIKRIAPIYFPLPFRSLPYPIQMLVSSNSSLKLSITMENLKNLCSVQGSYETIEFPKHLRIRFSAITALYAKNTPQIVRDAYMIPFQSVINNQDKKIKVGENDKKITIISHEIENFSPIINSFLVKITNANMTNNSTYFGDSNDNYLKNYLFSHMKFIKGEHNLSQTTIDLKNASIVSLASTLPFTTVAMKPTLLTPRIEKLSECSLKFLLNTNNNGDDFWLQINSNIPFNSTSFPRNLYFDPLAIKMQIPEYSLLLIKEFTLVFDQLGEDEILDTSICDGTDEFPVYYTQDGFCAWKNLGIKLADIEVNNHSFLPMFITPIKSNPNIVFKDRSILSSCRDTIINDPSLEGVDLDGKTQLPIKSYQSFAFKDNRTIGIVDEKLLEIRNQLFDPDHLIKKPKNLIMIDNRVNPSATCFFDVFTTTTYPTYQLEIDSSFQIVDGGFSGIKKTWAQLNAALDLEYLIKVNVVTRRIIKFSPESGISICTKQKNKDLKRVLDQYLIWHKDVFPQQVGELQQYSNGPATKKRRRDYSNDSESGSFLSGEDE